MDVSRFLDVAFTLDEAGLVWKPSLGDEISHRESPESIAILVSPEALKPEELRLTYFWLPTFDQLMMQLEARQIILFHAGLHVSPEEVCYQTVIQDGDLSIESKADSLRTAMAISLLKVLDGKKKAIH